MISSYAQEVLSRSRGKLLLLDSNVLLLLLLGSFDIRLIKSVRRLSAFSLSDFRILRDISLSFKIATSAHVLTEISNLCNDLPQYQKQIVFPYIASRIQYLRESVIPARDIAIRPEFSAFGLTDAALSMLSESHLLITNDRRLAAHLRYRNCSVLTLDDLHAGK